MYNWDTLCTANKSTVQTEQAGALLRSRVTKVTVEYTHGTVMTLLDSWVLLSIYPRSAGAIELSDDFWR